MRRYTVKCVLVLCLTLLFLPPAFAEEPKVKVGSGKVVIQGDSISADLKNAVLADVLKDIEAQRKIWFKGEKSLLEEKVSVSFSNLSLNEGIKRILAGMNYMVVFDPKGQPAGINIVGKKTPGPSLAGSAGQSSSQTAAQAPKAFPAVQSSPEVAQKPEPSNRTAESSSERSGVSQAQAPGRAEEELPPGFKVVPGAAPPGKPASPAQAASQAKKFEVQENVAPPGAPAGSGAAGQSGALQSSQPPGGPVTMTEEEKALFPARKRTPPAP